MDPAVLAELISQYSYVVLSLAIFVFGPLVSLVAGVLLRLEVIVLVPTCLALAAGELGSDALWYWLGSRYGESFVKKYGRYFSVTPASVGYAKKLFEQHHDIIIFSSKITSGLGFGTAIMFTAGLSKVPFRRYMMLNAAGQFFWTAGMLSIGYFLGHLYLKVGNVFEKMALFALLIVIFLSLWGFMRYLKRMFIEAPPTA